MNKIPIYIKYNSNRKLEFQLRTEIYEEESQFTVYKIACNEKSINFLKNLSDTYKILTTGKLPIKINKLKRVNERTLKFDYIKGITMLGKLEESAMKNSKNECLKIFQDFAQILDNLPSINATLGEEFVRIFGNDSKVRKYHLLKSGLLDITLDNIIIDNLGDFNLIDYEWRFPFGIPKRYILYRAIYSSFIRLGDSLTNLIKIRDVEKLFNFSEKEIKLYSDWETNLQIYVTGKKLNSSNGFTLRESVISSKITKTQIIPEEETLQEIDDLKNENLSQAKNIRRLNQQLQEFNSFKSGLIWKYLTKYRKRKAISKRESKKNNTK